MPTFIVKAAPNTPFEHLDCDDQQDLEAITKPREYVADNEDAALDEFHATVPIACLEQFDITCALKVD